MRYFVMYVFPRLVIASLLTIGLRAAAEVVNVRDPPFRARGDNIGDDSGAFALAISRVNAIRRNGGRAELQIPAGFYRLKAQTLPPFLWGGFVSGVYHQSVIVVDPAYKGDVFSWSEAWEFGKSYSPQSLPLDPTNDRAGPGAEGIVVTGSPEAQNVQNAFVFYGRNDLVLMRDIEVHGMHGSCLATGIPSGKPFAFIRESNFFNVYFSDCGAASAGQRQDIPVIELDSFGSGDTTNELSFYAINIFEPAGRGIVIRNENTKKRVGQIRFFGLRIEGGSSGYGDQLQIGDAGSRYNGGVCDILVDGFVSNGSMRGFASIATYAHSPAEQPYGITVRGQIPSGLGVGINDQAGYGMKFQMQDMATKGTDLVVGSPPFVGNVEVDGNGSEARWTSKIGLGSDSFVRTPQFSVFGK